MRTPIWAWNSSSLLDPPRPASCRLPPSQPHPHRLASTTRRPPSQRRSLGEHRRPGRSGSHPATSCPRFCQHRIGPHYPHSRGIRLSPPPRTTWRAQPPQPPQPRWGRTWAPDGTRQRATGCPQICPSAGLSMVSTSSPRHPTTPWAPCFIWSGTNESSAPNCVSPRTSRPPPPSTASPSSPFIWKAAP